MAKGLNAQEIVDKFAHHNLHSQLLLELYPDLQMSVSGLDVSYFSTIINAEVDSFNFAKDYVSTYVGAYSIYPHKLVKIECPSCGDTIRVNSTPSRIPLVMEHETAFSKEYIWYGLIFQEIMILNNFSSNTLSAARLHLIGELERLGKQNSKVELTYLNDAVKKLLPFT